MKRVFVAVLGALMTLGVLALPAAAGSFSQDFESNTDGWFDSSGTITQRASGYSNPGGYADQVNAAGGSYFAGLERGECTPSNPAGTDVVNCSGPFTRWGGYNSVWTGGWTTQVDIYLDVAYAQANEDSYAGNITCLTASNPSNDSDCKGTRFDFTSAVTSAAGAHLRDFGFNVSTGYGQTAADICPNGGFVVTAQTNVARSGANPNQYPEAHDPQCIEDSGWYTFKHTFSDDGSGFLKVQMDIIPVGSSTPEASWTLMSGDPISSGDPTKDVGCNRYGWFADQEIYGLPIDNASMTGCGQPVITDGQISPTKTTCEQYRDGTASDLEQVLYTTKGDALNALSPGVFFYYGKVSGTEGDTVDITQTNDGITAPPIPILNGQVVLYDASTCDVVKWDVTEPSTGEATGTLPSSGDFIIGVKYSPSDLKGEPALDPETVTYSFGTATVDLTPKH